MSGAASELLTRLRQETAPLHGTLDSLPLLSRLASGGLVPAGYAEILRRFVSALGPLEAALLPHAGGVFASFGFPFEPRLHWLLEDLIFLDAEVPAAADRVPGVWQESASAVGALYVLEGSRLGSVMIAKAVQQHLGFEAGAGASYFARSAQGRDSWKRFCAALPAWAAAHPGQWDSAVSGACGAFEWFLSHLAAPEASTALIK